MNIGIDIDNTITDTLPILKQYCKKYNEEVVKRNLGINEYGFATFNLYDWTTEEDIDFCEKYLEEIVLQAKVKQNAAEVIKRLKEEENKIYIMTARTKPNFRDPYTITEKFLRDNNIIYNELIVGSTKKDELCMKYNIDIMIDDEPQNINAISKNIPVIVFKAKHNEVCEGKNIIKVDNWNQVYEIIKKIKEENK